MDITRTTTVILSKDEVKAAFTNYIRGNDPNRYNPRHELKVYEVCLDFTINGDGEACVRWGDGILPTPSRAEVPDA